MPNHFHLLAETPEPNLIAGMKWLLGTYSMRYNVRHRIRGHVFAGRYRAQTVSATGQHVENVADYIHLNPARAGVIPTNTKLRDYFWSSLHWHLGPIEDRPGWIATERVVAERPKGRKLEARLENLRSDKGQPQFDSIRSQWCYGEEEFRLGLLRRIGARGSSSYYGAELREAAIAKAEAIVNSTLGSLNWDERELRARPKGDPEKLTLAERLRAETIVTLDWIAERLHMGARSYLAHLLYWKRRGQKPARPGKVPAATPRRPPAQDTIPRAAHETEGFPSATTPIVPSSEILFDPTFD